MSQPSPQEQEERARAWYLPWYRRTYPNSKVPDDFILDRVKTDDECLFTYAADYHAQASADIAEKIVDAAGRFCDSEPLTIDLEGCTHCQAGGGVKKFLDKYLEVRYYSSCRAT